MKKPGFTDSIFTTGKKPYLIIAVFSFFLYGNTVFNKYNLDDELVTSVSEAKLHKLTSKGISALPEIFKSNYYSDDQGYSYEYRPLVLASFAIEHSLFGDNPHVGHFINTLLYSLLCLLMLLVLSLLLTGYSTLLPLLITLFFAAFPLHTEVVASLKNRDELLALSGGMGALYCFLHYADRRNLLFLLGGALCFAAAMLSKQTIISFVLLIPMLLFLFREVSPGVALTVTGLLCAIIFPLILKMLLIERLSIIAGILLSTFTFYTIRYRASLKEWNFSNPFLSFGKRFSFVKPLSVPKPTKVGLVTDRKIFFILFGVVTASVVVLLLSGTSWYLLPFTLFIPLFLFFPIQSGILKFIFLWLAALVAMFLSSIMVQSDLFDFFFLLLTFSFLLKNEITVLETVNALVILLVGSYLNFDSQDELFTLNISRIVWNTVPFAGMAGMILLPARKFIFSTIASLPIVFTLLSEIAPDGKLAVGNFVNLYFYNFMGVRLVVTLLIFYFTRQRKLIIPLASVYLLSLAFLHHHFAFSFPSRVKSEWAQIKMRVSGGAEAGYGQFKGKLGEARYEVMNYEFDNSVQEEKALYRPVDYVESVTGLESSMGEKWGTGMVIIGNYLKLTLLPYPMSFYYGFKCIEKTDFKAPVSLFVFCFIVFLLLLALWKVNKNPLFSAGILIYLAAIFPLANIIMPVSGMLADRYLFIPSLGFSILLTLALCALAKFPLRQAGHFAFSSLPPLLKYSAVAILLIYSGITVARNSQWHDPIKLMRHDIKHLRKSAQAQNLLASHLTQQAIREKQEQARISLLQEAEKHYENAVSIYPDFFNAQYDLGRVRLLLGKNDDAATQFLKVVELDSSFSEPYLQLGMIKAGKGDFREAISFYHRYLEKNPGSWDALMNLSYCYALTGNFPNALITMKKAAGYFPGRAEPLITISRIFIDTGKPDSAAVYLQRAEKIAPNHRDIPQLKAALGKPASPDIKH